MALFLAAWVLLVALLPGCMTPKPLGVPGENEQAYTGSSSDSVQEQRKDEKSVPALDDLETLDTLVFGLILDGAGNATDAEITEFLAVMDARLRYYGIFLYELSAKEDGFYRLVLPLLLVGETDMETLAAQLFDRKLLVLREGYEVDSQGLPTGVTAENVILSNQGEDIAEASSRYGPLDSSGINQHYVQLELSENGTQKFTEATTRISEYGGSISIWFDDTPISNPSVFAPITGSAAVIVGNFTAESAAELAAAINQHALPFDVLVEYVEGTEKQMQS